MAKARRRPGSEQRAEQALWEGKPEGVLEMLAEAAQQPKGQAALAQRHYFGTNQQRMRYPSYRDQGYPIGSGRMESGRKQLIIARARQSGMSWSKQGLQPVLALRAELLSDRFDEAWLLTQERAAQIMSCTLCLTTYCLLPGLVLK
jgi:hypothetical protein